MSSNVIGVLVMAYGTPQSMDDVYDYYTHIRRGNPPAEEDLSELKERYEAIGGTFPLRQHTTNQVHALETELNNRSDEIEYRCYTGLKHAAPFIEDGVKQIAQDGITEAIGIVLAPHYSTMSVGAYNHRAQEEATKSGVRMRFVHQYHLHPQFIAALADRVQEKRDAFAAKEDVRIIFSAHSLPKIIEERNDPYPAQLLQTSKAIAEKVGTKNWQFAWQSAGKTAMPWLGPDILDELERIHHEENVHHVIICPIGFVSDHLEILYDIDIECVSLAQKLGMELTRTASLNDDPAYMRTLADAVIAKQNGELTESDQAGSQTEHAAIQSRANRARTKTPTDKGERNA